MQPRSHSVTILVSQNLSNHRGLRRNRKEIMDKLVMELGRILFSIIFISSGFNHFLKIKMLTGYAKYKRIPLAMAAVILTGLVLILGGVYILIGFYVDLGGLIVAIFSLVAAPLFHDFWNEQDAVIRANTATAFWRNIAIAGAGLMIFALAYKATGITSANYGWVISKAHVSFWGTTSVYGY